MLMYIVYLYYIYKNNYNLFWYLKFLRKMGRGNLEKFFVLFLRRKKREII